MLNLGAIVTLILSFSSLIIQFQALLSKSELERVFMTDDQKIKRGYIRLFGISAALGFLVADLYYLWCVTFRGANVGMLNWPMITGMGVTVFALSLILYGPLEKIGRYIFERNHVRYKYEDRELGMIYITKMMNSEVCICCTDSTGDLNQNSTGTYLIKLDDIMKEQLIREEVPKAKNIFRKLFSYISPSPVS